MLTWLACSFALGAGIVDARAGRIPNVLTLPGIVLGSVAAYFQGGPRGLLAAVVGVTVCGGLLGIPFLMTRGRAIGGGDVKCWAALGAMLGPAVGLSALLASLCTLLLFALFREAYHGRLTRLLQSLGRVLTRRQGSQEAALTTMRFGPAIAVGTVITAYPELIDWAVRLWL